MTEAARRGKTLLLLAVLLLLAAIPLGAWLLRGTIATSLVRDELAREGIVCDERFEVEPSALFDAASIGPTRCSHEGGIVEAFEVLGSLTVDLDGFDPAAVQADSVRLVLREGEVQNGDGWAQVLGRMRLEQAVAGLVKGLSELSALDLPPIVAGNVEVTRGAQTLATASGLALEPGETMRVAADRIAFASPAGLGRLELTGVTGTATVARVQLAGRGDVSLGAGLLGLLSTGGAFRLDADGLDTGRPRFSLRL